MRSAITGPCVAALFSGRCRWLILLAVVLIAFAAALFTAFKGADLSHLAQGSPEAGECFELLEKLSTKLFFGVDFLYTNTCSNLGTKMRSSAETTLITRGRDNA